MLRDLTTRLFEGVLDASIVWSFDRSGFERHQQRFDPSDDAAPLTKRSVLITGANSGIGLAAAKALAARGATVWVGARDRARGEAAVEAVRAVAAGGASVQLLLIDLASHQSIRTAVLELGGAPIDVLVHNAGLLPRSAQTSQEGLELTTAVHVSGPHLLTRLLTPRLRQSADARVITVSSGGMYTQRLDPSRLATPDSPYDGVVAYARTKRAQVVLNELWQRRFGSANLRFAAMHPGWAATPGVEQSLPGFWNRMQGRLRSPEQGADTVVWLAACPNHKLGAGGDFWFDRAVVSPHYLPWTQESEEQREELWSLCEQWTM
jgi:NAD(P)-dependent dehydrogenase (short-subunit alcohol dehydrogenase family)